MVNSGSFSARSLLEPFFVCVCSTYLELLISLTLKSCSNCGILGAQELERLRDGCHRGCSPRNLLLELIECVDALGLVPVGKALHKQLKLLLQLLVFLILHRQVGDHGKVGYERKEE